MAATSWQAVETSVGAGASTDYSLALTAVEERYRDTLPELSALLRSAPARIAAEEFERADGLAIEAQRAFKRGAGQANAAALATSCAGALVLVLGLLDAPGVLLLIFGIGGAAAGASGAFLLQRLRQQHLLQRWMSARAEAEQHRFRHFELVALADPPAGAEPTHVMQLQLEYFRRYQLDVQVRYYDTRQRQHQRAADRTVTYAAGAGFFAALSTGLAGLLAAGQSTDWAGLAALGIAGAALATYAAVRDSISQDARNAERFERTRAALRRVSVRLDEVREAVAEGNRAALAEFVAAVHEQLSLEHRQWVNEVDGTRTALSKLDDALQGGGAPVSAEQAPTGAP